MSKGGGVVEGAMIIKIPKEGDKDDGWVEGNHMGRDVDAWRGGVDGEK